MNPAAATKRRVFARPSIAVGNILQSGGILVAAFALKDVLFDPLDGDCGHARSGGSTGGEQYVWINCEANGCSWEKRRNDRNIEGSAADMPGCLSYVVAKDSADENVIWVTEAWESIASHDASLSSPSVKNAIPRTKAMVSSFEKIAVTTPVWGVGLPLAHPR